MKSDHLREYLVDGKHCVDVSGVAVMLGKAVGTIRNMTKIKDFPPYTKKGRKLYFEKALVEEFKKNREVIEISK